MIDKLCRLFPSLLLIASFTYWAYTSIYKINTHIWAKEYSIAWSQPTSLVWMKWTRIERRASNKTQTQSPFDMMSLQSTVIFKLVFGARISISDASFCLSARVSNCCECEFHINTNLISHARWFVGLNVLCILRADSNSDIVSRKARFALRLLHRFRVRIIRISNWFWLSWWVRWRVHT